MKNGEFIIKQQENYHQVRAKTLTERIGNIEMNKSEENSIRDSHAIKVLKDKLLGSFKVVELVNVLLDWNKEVNEELANAKKEYLLETYLNKVDKNEQCISQLRDFLSKPHGYSLFNKIIQILDDNPPDQELINTLANCLKYIINNDNFEVLFDIHKYALSQIEHLTTQSISILLDYKSYPIFNLGTYASQGEYIQTEWVECFARKYAQMKNVTNESYIARINHSINSLKSQGYLIAIDSTEGQRCILTQVGRDLLEYVKDI